jgi:hypothetical protein
MKRGPVIPEAPRAGKISRGSLEEPGGTAAIKGDAAPGA